MKKLVGLQIYVKEIDRKIATYFIQENHYSPVMPPITKVSLGCYIESKDTLLGETLVGVITLGYGTRPLHTISKLFPALTSKDYLEIGKMCMADEMPRNSESKFISLCVKWIKSNKQNCKYLFTWSDGIIGKVGYVYQSSNFLYGGFIWTDVYVSDEGEKIHPRNIRNFVLASRPTHNERRELKLKHIKGKQFRYIYPLDKKSRQQLIQSSVSWGLNHPKDVDLEWKFRDHYQIKFTLTKTIPYHHNSEAINFNRNNVNKVSNRYGRATFEAFL